MEDLRERGVGTLLGYNIEAEMDGSSKDPELILKQTQCVLISIEAQGQLAKRFWPKAGDNRCWVRIKITGLLPHPIALDHASHAITQARRAKGLDKDVPYPGLPHDGDWDAALNGQGVTDPDREQLYGLRATMEAIASKARDNNVCIVIDAEQSWYQPAIDALTDELMQEYNALDGPATIIASFQAYLRRHPQLIDHQIRRAEDKGYQLLFKQVRGAYMVTEAARCKEAGRDGQSPVWSTKAETDASFNNGMDKTVAAVAAQIQRTGRSRISAVFATHNSLSLDEGLEALQRYRLVKGTDENGRLRIPAEVAASFAFAQIYGEFYLVAKIPFVSRSKVGYRC
jgi:proline dehydrogenase